MKYTALIMLFLLLHTKSIAQNHWLYLPNNNLQKGSAITDTERRFEDVYFIDTVTGFAVTLSNRLLKTIDGGINWSVKNDTSADVFFRSIEMSDNGQYGIAGSLGLNASVLRTSDYGETWQNITTNISDTTTGASRHNICGLAHFGDAFYGVGSWGSTTAKFFRSIDKGATWQTKYMDTNLVKNLVDVVFLSPDTGFISGARGHESIVLKTIDGGANWVKVFGDTTIGGKIWKLQFLDNRIAYASIEPLFSHDTVNMIYSYDGGDNWTIVHVGKIATKPGGWGTQGVGFVKAAKGWVGGYFDGIFETTDSGKTWNHISFGYDFNRIFVIDSNHVFAGGHSVYKYGSGIFTGVKETGISNPPHILYPVSPNPTKGNVKIEFDLKRSTNVVLDVVSMDSRHIFPVTNVFLNPGHYTYYWNDIEAQPGNYIIWLGTNEIPIVQKFVLLE